MVVHWCQISVNRGLQSCICIWRTLVAAAVGSAGNLLGNRVGAGSAGGVGSASVSGSFSHFGRQMSSVCCHVGCRFLLGGVMGTNQAGG